MPLLLTRPDPDRFFVMPDTLRLPPEEFRDPFLKLGGSTRASVRWSPLERHCVHGAFPSFSIQS
jgi:hypothetical protein